MIEILKNVALSIAVVGFGLSVMFPFLVQAYAMTGLGMLVRTTTIKEKISKMLLLLMSVIATILVIAYFIITLHYIWR
ncbi:hypothetical protein [Yersinia phage fHe-Yen9-04]|uniref:Uncharacterized protein n=2 Tax=Eneladusvirus Yen904 TaxID=2560849 RepID=A0A2C9CXA3_9CAUD|nr:membrane protein [Yersinia phage fHe-Yen9-04]SOK58376.1 hypothetical protein [Yersinia phage fHe-Yen9-04]SOK58911.1 hypothetical protein [Yersinia phage fHe-Yen9-03]VUE36145.1 hypothetical protein [Yersinia phage fHe-Yen9-04]